ncbi:unnamed protein product [Durusdinium trenchii]|uniref:Poly(ADP-ribose) glycohydrolase n=1 Tax=Durusdinium trenchii TaxID=1381693 RepID=A0ABP0HTJ7_9DINO
MSLLGTLRPLICAIAVSVCCGAAPKNRQGKFEAETLEAEVSQDGHIAMHNSLKPSFKDPDTEFIELEEEEEEEQEQEEEEGEDEKHDEDAEQESAGCRRRDCRRRFTCHRRRVNCVWATWKPWTQCSKACATGKTTRVRPFARAAAHEGCACTGPSKEEKTCNTHACPINCAWGKWNAWQKCSKPCGGGEQKRNRPVAKAAAHGGKKCDGAAEEKKKCNEHKCPIDCVYGEWGEWADCSVTCGNGTRKHTREVETEAQHGGKECEGEAEEEGPCDPVPEKCGALGSQVFRAPETGHKAPDRETFYQSFAFLWTFVLRLAATRGHLTRFNRCRLRVLPPGARAGVQVPQVKPGPALHSRNGSFDWIRTANEKEDRDLRAQTATLTLKACRACGYQLSAGGVVPLRHTDMMVEGTKILTLEEVAARLGPPSRGFFSSPAPPRLTTAAQGTALDAALALAERRARVAVLSAASAYHPCGGFRTGGRHALEESMCVQSTLSLSLQRALYISRHGNAQVSVPERLKRDQRSEWFCYIPETGGILSPKVEVFRKGSAEGYGFLPSPVELASVVSVAMPNKNPNVKDSPLDAPESPDEYRALLVAKLKVALGAAAMSGASACVVPGLGCGVFKNDPGDVGAALGEAIAWAPLCGKLQEVILAGVPKALEAAARR